MTSIQAEGLPVGDGFFQRRGEGIASGDAHALAAESGGGVGEVPVVQVVVANVFLEGLERSPGGVVEDQDDGVPFVAAAVAELPVGHLEGAVAY